MLVLVATGLSRFEKRFFPYTNTESTNDPFAHLICDTRGRFRASAHHRGRLSRRLEYSPTPGLGGTALILEGTCLVSSFHPRSSSDDLPFDALRLAVEVRICTILVWIDAMKADPSKVNDL